MPMAIDHRVIVDMCSRQGMLAYKVGKLLSLAQGLGERLAGLRLP